MQIRLAPEKHDDEAQASPRVTCCKRNRTGSLGAYNAAYDPFSSSLSAPRRATAGRDPGNPRPALSVQLRQRLTRLAQTYQHNNRDHPPNNPHSPK